MDHTFPFVVIIGIGDVCVTCAVNINDNCAVFRPGGEFYVIFAFI